MPRVVLVDPPWNPGLPGVVNVMAHPGLGGPFASIQAAHDYVEALPDRGVVLVPPGEYNRDTTPAFTGLVTTGAVGWQGCGRANSVFSMAGQDPDLHAITVTGEKVAIRDITIEGQGVAGDGCGIYIGHPTAGLENTTIEFVEISDTPSWAIEQGGDGNGVNIAIYTTIRECKIHSMVGAGAIRIGPANTSNRIECVHMPTAPGGGHALIELDGAWGTVINQCRFDTIGAGGTGVKWHVTEDSGFPFGLDILHCWFEDHSDPALWDVSGKPFHLEFDCRRTPVNTGQLLNARVERCRFVNAQTGVGPVNQVNRIARFRSDTNPCRGFKFTHNEVHTRQSGAAAAGDITFDANNHWVILEDNFVYNANTAVPTDFTANLSPAGLVRRWDWGG